MLAKKNGRNIPMSRKTIACILVSSGRNAYSFEIWAHLLPFFYRFLKYFWKVLESQVKIHNNLFASYIFSCLVTSFSIFITECIQLLIIVYIHFEYMYAMETKPLEDISKAMLNL